ncbi:MAG: replication-associated recombination protein A [Bacillota bacterium]
MRPGTLEEFIGQEDLLGHNKLLRRLIEAGAIQSLLFFGPPGSGKTTLAHIIARRSNAVFLPLNAVTTGVGEIKDVIRAANDQWRLYGRKTIVFIDEFHRFNKAQQDVLLSAVENGELFLIGATTENPYYTINAPLLSRLNIFRFHRLNAGEIAVLLKRAIADPENGLGTFRISVDDGDLGWLANSVDGDVRSALNVLELAVLSTPPLETSGARVISKETFAQCMQKKVYDRNDEEHYHIISAFIKSMRGSDPDAAVYWLLRMLEAGEDPRFIARRMIVHAAEDVGLADPRALLVAVAAYQALEVVGLPEARIPLTEAALYIATAVKSNTVVETIGAALQDVQKLPWYAVPLHLREPGHPGDKAGGEGGGYLYPHMFPGHYVDQKYLPPELSGQRYFNPSTQGYEKDLQSYWDGIKNKKKGE